MKKMMLLLTCIGFMAIGGRDSAQVPPRYTAIKDSYFIWVFSLKETIMENKIKIVPDNFTAVTPWIISPSSAKLIEFL